MLKENISISEWQRSVGLKQNKNFGILKKKVKTQKQTNKQINKNKQTKKPKQLY